jgi:hypothetical protein
MKKLLLAAALITSITIHSQVVPDTLMKANLVFGKMCTSIYAVSGSDVSQTRNYIMYWSDSTISITGDTVTAIKLFIDKYRAMQERYWEARVILDRINLMNLYKSVFKDDKQFLRNVKQYQKNKNRL